MEDAKRLETLQKTVLPPLQKELDQLNASSQALEGAIKSLQERILEVGGVRLRAAKAKVDGLNESLQTKNQQLIQAQVQLKTASKVGRCRRHGIYRAWSVTLIRAAGCNIFLVGPGGVSRRSPRPRRPWRR